MLEKAYNVALKFHFGQVDKGGNPYIYHSIMVSNMVCGNDNKIVGLLHDVVEDTELTLNGLSIIGFKLKIIQAIDGITKRKGESLESYLERVKSNEIATVVKIADLIHNSDKNRIKNSTQKDLDRFNKYKSILNNW